MTLDSPPSGGFETYDPNNVANDPARTGPVTVGDALDGRDITVEELDAAAAESTVKFETPAGRLVPQEEIDAAVAASTMFETPAGVDSGVGQPGTGLFGQTDPALTAPATPVLDQGPIQPEPPLAVPGVLQALQNHIATKLLPSVKSELADIWNKRWTDSHRAICEECVLDASNLMIGHLIKANAEELDQAMNEINAQLANIAGAEAAYVKQAFWKAVGHYAQIAMGTLTAAVVAAV